MGFDDFVFEFEIHPIKVNGQQFIHLGCLKSANLLNLKHVACIMFFVRVLMGATKYGANFPITILLRNANSYRVQATQHTMLD